MGRHEKLLGRILRGTSDANVSFEGLCAVITDLGFQPRGAQAKPYQVKQVRNVILKYRLAGQDNGEI